MFQPFKHLSARLLHPLTLLSRLFHIVWNSSPYTLPDRKINTARSSSTCGCPEASKNKQWHPLSCSQHPCDLTELKTLLALLAAAANRKDLRISTDSSLQSSFSCSCRLWIQFHAISLITALLPDIRPHIQLYWRSQEVLVEIFSTSINIRGSSVPFETWT